MKSKFNTAKGDEIRVYPSSNVYHRIWIKIDDGFDEFKEASTELSMYDCDILIAILKRARQWLSER
jgi:hypothetical protein